MDRVRLTPELSISRIAYGMWRLADDADTSPAHVQAKIEACLAQGITTIDQADIYGGYMAEEVLGRALTPSLRDQIQIVTKCGIVAPAGRHTGARIKHYDTSRAHIEASVDQSLRLMGIDAIDLLLIHRPDPFMDPAETGGALDALIRAGKVRAVGVSNFVPHEFTLLQSAMDSPLVTNEIELSLGRTDPLTNGDLAFLQERNLHPMAWSPLGGGRLMTDSGPLQQAMDRIAEETGGGDRAAVALAWLLAHPAVVVPVVGTNSLDRLVRVGAATQVALDRETWFELYTLALGHEVP